jgi:hypothetical protein
MMLSIQHSLQPMVMLNLLSMHEVADSRPPSTARMAQAVVSLVMFDFVAQ